MTRSLHWLAHPLVAGLVAMLIVIFAAAAAATHFTLHGSAVSGEVENVSVTKRIAVAPPAPELKLNVRQSQSTTPGSALAPMIARTAKVSLYVANVDKTAELLSRVARSNAGDVFSSDIANGDGSASQASGSMEIRIPAQRFDATMTGVERAGSVRERSTNAEDLTGQVTDSDARLRNLRRTEEDIRRIMDRSGSVSQVMSAEMQLSQVREQIETLESQLKDMRSRVAYATIDVDLEAETTTTPVTPTAASQLASAWHAAIASLGALTIGLVALALWIIVFVPYALAAVLVVWLIARKLRPALH
jgi:hypothetical protein